MFKISSSQCMVSEFYYLPAKSPGVKISIFEGEEQLRYIELPGDVSNYDIIIHSSTDVGYPPKELKEEPPAPPDINPASIDAKNNRNVFKRLRDNPDSQAAKVRKAIYQRQLLTRKELDSWLEANDYAARGGSAQTVLIVLEEITEEIKRIGESDDQQIVWIAET